MKNNLLSRLALITLTGICLFRNSASAQCTWHNQLYDGYEYTTACPDLIPGTTVHTIPQSFAVHNGNLSLYMNFVNSLPAGSLVYSRTIAVCPNIPVRISSWITTSFSGTQCNVKFQIFDGNNVLIDSTPSLLAAYAPTWTHYQSGTMTPTTSQITFKLFTNVAGSLGGNDLSMDDFLVEQCNRLNLGPDTTICNTQSLNLNAGNFYTSYLWSTSATSQTISATGNGHLVFSVTVVDTNGCTYADSIKIFFEVCTAVNNPMGNGLIKIYPNPASDHLSIVSDRPLESVYFILSDMTGRELLSYRVESGNALVSIPSLSAGVYLYQVTDGKNQKSRGTLVLGRN